MKKFKIIYSSSIIGSFSKIYVCESLQIARNTALNEIAVWSDYYKDCFSVDNIIEVEF